MDWRPLCVWLQRWNDTHGSLEGTELWALLPKGTKVCFLSINWLNVLWRVIETAPSLQSLQELLQFPLDNHDILSGEFLRPDAVLGVDYTIESKATTELVFGPLVTSIKPVGYIAWEGMMRPTVIPEPVSLPCVLCHFRNKVPDTLLVEGNIPLSEVIDRLERTRLLSLDMSSTEMVLHNVKQQYSQGELLSALDTCSDISEIAWLPQIAVQDSKECTIFEVLTSNLLCVEYKPKPSWLSSIFTSKFTPKIAGLNNMWNTCYLNSVLQCLGHIYPFLLHYSGKTSKPGDSPMLVELRNTLAAMHSTETRSFAPEEIMRLLAKISDSFEAGNQADAQECLLTIIDQVDVKPVRSDPALAGVFNDPGLAEEKAWLDYVRNSSVVSGELFGGLQTSLLKCQSCHHTTSTYTPFQSISLDLPSARTLTLTFIPLSLKHFPRQYQIRSSTPIETNETIHTIWQQIAAEYKIQHFMIGNTRNVLFEGPFGMSDLAVLTGYVVMELPEPGTCCIILDIYEENRPVASRILTFERHVKLEDIQEIVINELGEAAAHALSVDQHIMSLLSDLQTAKQMQNSIRPGATFYLTSLDCGNFSESQINLTELGGGKIGNIGDLLQRCGGKIPRFRINFTDFPAALKRCMQKHSQSRSFFFGDFLSRNSDESETILTLLQMMDFTLNEKPMNEDDLVTCAGCGCSTKHTTSLSFVHLPRVLVFVLQRIRLISSKMNKTEICIQYPVRGLDLTGYEMGGRCSPAIYDLKAVIAHKGSISRGHYTATVQDPVTSQWFHCDDASTKPVPAISALDDRNAYLLFYCRK